MNNLGFANCVREGKKNVEVELLEDCWAVLGPRAVGWTFTRSWIRNSRGYDAQAQRGFTGSCWRKGGGQVAC